VAVAAERIGRDCYSAEIDPSYFEMAARRLAGEDEPPRVLEGGAVQLPGENMIG